MAYKSAASGTAATLLILVLLVIALLYPFALIWSLNLLFNLTIAYTWQTWLAALLLSGPVIRSGSSSSSKR